MATHASRVGKQRRVALLHGVYVVLDANPRVLELANAVLESGVRILQYRAKRGIDQSDLRRLRKLTLEYEALLILNDDWRAASSFDCDGVHLGPEDHGFAQVATVRERLPYGLIGLSCGTIEEVRAANAAGADYLGVGAVYATTSKNDAGAPIGTGTLRRFVLASDAPVAAIGGITVATITPIRGSGAAMAAVISAISNAANPARAARELVGAWNA